MKYLTLIITTLIVLGCAKNKPEKFILGRWEVVNIDSERKTESNAHIFDDFKNDVSYFKEITFYEDSLVYLNYLNVQPILGTYYLAESIVDDFDFMVAIEHKNVNDTTYPKKFDFSNNSYFIKKLTRNRLMLELVYGNPDGIYEDFYIELKKTGKFE